MTRTTLALLERHHRQACMSPQPSPGLLRCTPADQVTSLGASPHWLEAVRGRHSLRALAEQLQEIPEACFGSLSDLEEVRRAYVPVRRVHQRRKALGELEQHLQCCESDQGPPSLDEPRWAIAQSSGRLHASIEAAYCAGLTADDPTEGEAMPGPASHPHAPSAPYIELCLRVTSVALAGSVFVERVTLTEELGAVPTRSRLDALVAEVASRDVYFSPPVALRERGTYLEFRTKLPALPSEHPAAVPIFSVVDVKEL